MLFETAGLSCGESDEPSMIAPFPADARIKKAALQQYASQKPRRLQSLVRREWCRSVSH